jgi:AGZA family xanthine/uracil permease-like MFS transporter
MKYIPIAIPFGLVTIVGGINNTESARAAGDDYAVRDILLVEAVATVVAGLVGGVAQSTPYIGHPAYKRMGARAGYTVLTGLAVGIGGMLGLVAFVTDVLPAAAVVPLLLFVGLEIAVQAFRVCPPRHAAAVAFSFLPTIADLLLIRQDQMLGALQGAIGAAGLGDKEAAMHALVVQTAESLNAPIVAGLGHGFILTAMMWGSFFALIIDRELRRASVFVALTGVMTLFGIVHSASPTGALYWIGHAPSPLAAQWAVGYFALAALLLAMSFVPRR